MRHIALSVNVGVLSHIVHELIAVKIVGICTPVSIKLSVFVRLIKVGRVLSDVYHIIIILFCQRTHLLYLFVLSEFPCRRLFMLRTYLIIPVVCPVDRLDKSLGIENQIIILSYLIVFRNFRSA